VKNKLKNEAGALLKDFLIWAYLKKKYIEPKRRTRMLMNVIVKSERFMHKRERIEVEQDNTDTLLLKLQTNLDHSVAEL